MGQDHSHETHSSESVSRELAQKFAKHCFSPLEITHFKDIFKTLADVQDGLLYWKEETLCRFLVLPDALGPGPVIYQMATWLGAFPFPSLAPSILTIEALLKVIVIMTERYGKVLKRNSDRNKLLFKSLAVFDRMQGAEKQGAEKQEGEKEEQAHRGFAIDEPVDDEDDDDDLALAALDALDAIEVFKQDQRVDKIQHAKIPVDNFRRLLMLLIVVAPLDAQESLSKHAQRLTESRMEGLKRVADSILWSFTPEENAGISYRSFNTIIPASLPYIFDGLNPLFEHFLFSKSLMQTGQSLDEDGESEPLLQREGDILNLNILSQLSFFLKGSNVFRCLRLLYNGSEAGFSMGSIEQKVFNWTAPTILLVSGTRLARDASDSAERVFVDSLPPKRFPDSSSGNGGNRVVYGAYLDVAWRQTFDKAIGGAKSLLFQLEPIHDVFRASSLVTDYAMFSKHGISFGSARSKGWSISPGSVSLTLDASLEYGVFNHDTTGGGAYHTSTSRKQDWQDRFEIESIEIWGCGGDEEAKKQRSAWEFEEREAAARRGMRRGKDIESDRALLEMAGLVGGHSGGSMG